MLIEYLLNEWIQVHINWNLIINVSLGCCKCCVVENTRLEHWVFIIGHVDVLWIIELCSWFIAVHLLIYSSKRSLLTTLSMIAIMLQQWDVSGFWDISVYMKDFPCPPWSCHFVLSLRQAKNIYNKVNSVEIKMDGIGRNYALLRDKRDFVEAAKTQW